MYRCISSLLFLCAWSLKQSEGLHGEVRCTSDTLNSRLVKETRAYRDVTLHSSVPHKPRNLHKNSHGACFKYTWCTHDKTSGKYETKPLLRLQHLTLFSINHKLHFIHSPNSLLCFTLPQSSNKNLRTTENNTVICYIAFFSMVAMLRYSHFLVSLCEIFAFWH